MSYPTQIIKEGNNILFKTDAGVILKVIYTGGVNAHPGDTEDIIYLNNITSRREEHADIFPIKIDLITEPAPPVGGWTQALLLQELSDNFINTHLNKINDSLGDSTAPPPSGSGILGWLKNIYDAIISTITDYKEFSTVIPFSLNSEVVIETSRYSSVGFNITPPNGGKVQFQGTFDGVNYTPITLREIGENGYTQISLIKEDYLGSISCLRAIKVKVIVAGVSDGVVAGKMSKISSTVEGIEHAAAPHLFGYKIYKKSFEFSIAQTNTILITPNAGKKWVITDLIFTSDSINEITIFDETNSIENTIIKLKTGQERFFAHPFRSVIESENVGNNLRVTSTSNSDFRGTIIYYEID